MSHGLRLVPFVALLIGVTAQTAVVQFSDLANNPRVPTDALSATSIAKGDVDGDGDLDLVIGDAARDRLWLNDGQRRFVAAGAARLPSDGQVTRGVVLVDVDRDGDRDVVLAKWGQIGAQNKLYLNDGRGTFTDATAQRMPAVRHHSSGVVADDVDRDGDIDLVFAGSAGCSPCLGDPTLLYLNDGTGTFRDASSTHLPPNKPVTFALAIGDVDGDGDLDLVLGNGYSAWNGSAYTGGQDFLYLNDGTGHFRDATASLPNDNAQSFSVILVDIDRDGDLDIVLAGGDNTTPTPSPISTLYRNDGRGRFTDVTATHMPRLLTTAAVAYDVDGDGDPDLVVGLWSIASVNEWPRLLLNDGTGRFAEAPAGRMPIGRSCVAASPLALDDLDGDRDPDLLLASFNQPLRLLTNAGAGRFTDTDPPRFPACAQPRAFAAGDVDGDGIVDVAIGASSFFFSQNRLLLGDGRGGFANVTGRLPTWYHLTYDVAFGDFDRDGDLDLLTGNSPVQTKSGAIGGENLLYRNDGTGRFTTAPSHPHRENTRALGVGDFDRDGDLDFIAVNFGDPTRVYLNDGTARFIELAGAIPLVAARFQAVALGDVDGDRDLDVVLAISGQEALLLNNGSGRFVDVTVTHLPRDTADTLAVRLVDIDGDRDLDLVLANAATPSRAWRNDGTGHFTDVPTAGLPAVSAQTTLATGDVDEDGDSDLLFGANLLYLNDGTGVFQLASSRVPPPPPFFSPVATLADIDCDGDFDLLTAERVLLNLHRQIQAPELAFPGGAFPIELFAQPGYATTPQAALVLLGSRELVPRLSVPPFGMLGVDPQRAVVLGPVFLSPPAGRASLPLAIPNVASLQGLGLFAQGLFAPTPQLADLRFSNVLAPRVQ